MYQLKILPDQYKLLDLDILTLADKLGDEQAAMQVFGQVATNESLKDIWQDIACTTYDMPDANKPEMPDISLWMDVYPFMNERAYDALKSHLSDLGEFLPIQVDGERFYVFNCMTFGTEDPSRVRYVYDEDVAIGVEELAFLDVSGETNVLFKSNISFVGSLFCTERFKQLCEEHKLKGLRFEEDLLAVF
ncbi:MAG: hypothetical protein LAT63_10025 [Marinobacter sp.]|nr:hypothetical protein [Marinobacter sp.]